MKLFFADKFWGLDILCQQQYFIEVFAEGINLFVWLNLYDLLLRLFKSDSTLSHIHNEGFSTESRMWRHINMVHDDSPKPWECKLCGQKFKNKPTLAKHLKREHGKSYPNAFTLKYPDWNTVWNLLCSVRG